MITVITVLDSFFDLRYSVLQTDDYGARVLDYFYDLWYRVLQIDLKILLLIFFMPPAP